MDNSPPGTSEKFPVWVKSGSAAFTDILHSRNGNPIYANGFCFFGDVPDGTWESPTDGKVSCCGARQKLRLSKQACFLPTAATRSPRFIRPPRCSVRSPPDCFLFALSTPIIPQIPYKNRRYPKISPVFMGWMMGVEPTTFRATI